MARAGERSEDGILDVDQLISSDDDTWLYSVESPTNGRHEYCPPNISEQTPTNKPGPGNQTPPNHPSPVIQPPTSGGGVGGGPLNTRTFTRRKCVQRPSLESVVESPNRSSLGLINNSLMNEAMNLSPPNQERISSSSTGFDTTHTPPRTFYLDIPFTCYPTPPGLFSMPEYTRARRESESSDVLSLDSLISLEKRQPLLEANGMTTSLVQFLENDCKPPIEFRDEPTMTDSSLGLAESCDGYTTLERMMTNSMINFLKSSSVNSVGDSDLSNSLSGRSDSPNNAMLNETENIPPNLNNHKDANRILDVSNCIEKKAAGDGKTVGDNLTSTFTVNEKNRFDDDMKTNVALTNSRNVGRTWKEKGQGEDLSSRRLAQELNVMNEISRPIFKKDLNITRDLNVDNRSSTPCLTRNDTFTKISQADLKTSKNKTGDLGWNLNGTKVLESSKKHLNSTYLLNGSGSLEDVHLTKLHHNEVLNGPFSPNKRQQLPERKSTEDLIRGVEEDQSSTDSSFSSCSTKPRSVDELRTIAAEQEKGLVQQTSTSTPKSLADNGPLDLDLSPITRLSLEREKAHHSESRSANCSPVRNPLSRPSVAHPIRQIRMPSVQARRQTLAASSLSNIAIANSMPIQASGLKSLKSSSNVVRPVSRLPGPMSRPTVTRPLTTAIPRPKVSSKLPMPQSRSTFK